MELTKEQIEKMEAGEAIDALVAEKVMDWQLHAAFDPDVLGRFSNWIDTKTGAGMCQPDEFQPSTDIAAAWMVVEKFPAIVIQRASSADGSTVGYRCSLPLTPNIERLAGLQRATIDADAETAPLAICRAALFAATGAK